MAVDALLPGGARSSAAVILKMQDEHIFHKEGFELSTYSQIWEMRDHTNLVSFKQIQHSEG